MSNPNYGDIAKEARKTVLRLIYKAQTSHIGSNFSAIDIMAVLFEKVDIKKDEAVLSAGWKAASWYFFLWKKGVITEEELNSFCMPDSKFIGLVEPMERWGLRCAGGSMGLSLPAAVGLALAKKLKGEEGTVFVLMSDGEQQCGTTWESILIAVHHKLDNLIVIVDENGSQAMGKTSEILKIYFPNDDYLPWSQKEVDGHDYKKIEGGLIPYQFPGNTPHFVIAHTIKGKGVSFMENNNLYHYKNLSTVEYEEALKELNG